MFWNGDGPGFAPRYCGPKCNCASPNPIKRRTGPRQTKPGNRLPLTLKQMPIKAMRRI